MSLFLIQIQHDMKETSLLFLFFIFSPILSYSQRITITGKVEIINTDENWDYRTIEVENLKSNGKVRANDKGIFSIAVQLNDVLEFSGSYLENRSIKINENILNKGFLKVELEVEEIELAEVQLNPLKRYWKDNLSKEASQQEKMYELIGFDQAFKLDMVKGLLAIRHIKKNGGVASYENMMKIKDQFTEEAKVYRPEIRKEKPQIIRHDEILQIKAFFTDSYFIDSLKIPEERIYDFVSYCYDVYNFRKLLEINHFDEMFFHFSEGAVDFLNLLKVKDAK